MDIDKFKKAIFNVGLNYDFFNFKHQRVENQSFFFSIKKIRAYEKNSANNFYKSMSRSILIKNIKEDE